jgi:hypothetical protein
MQLVDPRGGLILVERPAPAFTPAEYARARALVKVVEELLHSRPAAQEPPAESDAA